jgi:hypothetical protein
MIWGLGVIFLIEWSVVELSKSILSKTDCFYLITNFTTQLPGLLSGISRGWKKWTIIPDRSKKLHVLPSTFHKHPIISRYLRLLSVFAFKESPIISFLLHWSSNQVAISRTTRKRLGDNTCHFIAFERVPDRILINASCRANVAIDDPLTNQLNYQSFFGWLHLRHDERPKELIKSLSMMIESLTKLLLLNYPMSFIINDWDDK